MPDAAHSAGRGAAASLEGQATLRGVQGQLSYRPRVLFVDDEPAILRALKRDTSRQTHWEMTFCSNGEDALDQICKHPFDVIVTDMVMPGIDGAELLHKAKALCPSVGRIVLSGHGDFEHAVKSVPFAHRRLLKPWDRSELIDVVESVCRLRETASDELVKQTIGRLGALPSSARVYLALSMELDRPSASFASVASIIEQDMAMSAKLLQLANSAFLGLRRDVVSVPEAVRMVGLAEIRHYLLRPFLDVFDVFAVRNEPDAHEFSLLNSHAMLTARLCRVLAELDGAISGAFVAGLLHDLGSVLMLTHMPKQKRLQVAALTQVGVSQIEAERSVLNTTHAEMAGHLLGVWGVPHDVVEAVRRHHETGKPQSVIEETLRLADAWVERYSRTPWLLSDAAHALCLPDPELERLYAKVVRHKDARHLLASVWATDAATLA